MLGTENNRTSCKKNKTIMLRGIIIITAANKILIIRKMNEVINQFVSIIVSQ